MTLPPRATLHVAASAAGIAAAADGLAKYWEEAGFDPESAWPFHVALDEILSNIVRHGGPQGREPLIEVSFAIAAAGPEVTIVDDGPGFDPLDVPEPDLTSSIDQRQPGGLGVHLVTRLMDRVEYARREGSNHLVISRRVPPPNPSDRKRE